MSDPAPGPAHIGLATLLEEHGEPLLRAWRLCLRRLPKSHYARRADDEIAAWTERGFAALLAALRTGDGTRAEVYARQAGEERARQGFAIGDVAQGMLLLQEHAQALALERLPAAVLPDALGALTAHFRHLMAALTGAFADAMLTSAQRRAQVTAALLARMAALEERQRVARELHDSVIQSLYGVSLTTTAAGRLIEAGAVDAAVAELARARDATQAALKEMRRLIHDLRPSELVERGLAGAIRARLAAVEERAGVRVTTSFASVELPRATEEALHRVALAALDNALHHGGGATIEVTLAVDEARGHVVLRVADSGVGFDPAAAVDSGGFGLRGMRERVEGLGGRLEIASAVGAGAAITAIVPLRAPTPGWSVVDDE